MIRRCMSGIIAPEKTINHQRYQSLRSIINTRPFERVLRDFDQKGLWPHN